MGDVAGFAQWALNWIESAEPSREEISEGFYEALGTVRNMLANYQIERAEN